MKHEQGTANLWMVKRARYPEAVQGLAGKAESTCWNFTNAKYNNMQLKDITPMLWVDDVRASIDYYVSVLGFDETNYLEDGNWGMVEKHKVRIMLSRPGKTAVFERPAFTGSLFIRTDDAEAWWQFLKERAEVVYPIDDFEYGMREFAIRDCNGYVLRFGEDLI